MSKASEWVQENAAVTAAWPKFKCRPEKEVLVDTCGNLKIGLVGERGPTFDPEEAIALAKWITDTFGV
jgi:hypothetical protein